MSLEITVVGALRATIEQSLDGEASAYQGERRPAGMASQLAVALARLGHGVRFAAALSNGEFRPSLRAPLIAEGVEVVPFAVGAKASVEVAAADTDDADALIERIGTLPEAMGAIGVADAVVCQLELADEPLSEALELAHGANRLTILHASPARELDPKLLQCVDALIASESEARILARCLGEKVGPRGLARRIAALGPGKVIISSAGAGAMLFDGERFLEVEHNGASDNAEGVSADLPSEFVFAAALTTALAREWRSDLALRFAQAAAQLAAGGDGPFPSLPSSVELESCQASIGARAE